MTEGSKEDQLIGTAKEIFFKTGKPGFILLSIYDILLRREEIDPIEESDNDFIVRAERRIQQEAAKRGTIALKELAHEKGTAIYNKTLEDECKRQAVANYFTKQKMIDDF